MEAIDLSVAVFLGEGEGRWFGKRRDGLQYYEGFASCLH